MQICNWFYSKLGYRLHEGLSFLVYSYSWGSCLWVPIYNRPVYLSEPVLHDRILTLIFVPIKLTGALFSLSALQLTFSTQPQGGLRHSISGVPVCVSVLSESWFLKSSLPWQFSDASYTHETQNCFFFFSYLYCSAFYLFFTGQLLYNKLIHHYRKPLLALGFLDFLFCSISLSNHASIPPHFNYKLYDIILYLIGLVHACTLACTDTHTHRAHISFRAS